MTTSREDTQKKLSAQSAAVLAHTPGQKLTVADLLEARAFDSADRAFVFFGDRTISFRDMNAEANRVAHSAHTLGLRTGDVAALMMENRPEFIATWGGLAKLGVVTALINTHVRGNPLRHALDATGGRHVFAGRECLANLMTAGDDLAERFTLHARTDPDAPDEPLPAGVHDQDEALRAAPDSNPDPSLRAELCAGDDLFHIFTSGTTGLPKAARLSHMRFLGVGDGMSQNAGYGPDDVIYCVLPLYHGAAGMVIVSCALSQGCGIALRRRFSARAFWDDVRRYDVTGCQYIGEICRYLLNQPARADDRDHGLRVLMGAGLGPDIWAAFQERFGIDRILEGWSSTEANTSLINLDGKVGSVGRIPFPELHNGRLIQYDVETDSHPRSDDGIAIPCGPGEVGEFIGAIPDLPDSGAGRFEGYTSSEATERKILHDVFQSGDRWYRSGDLLRYDEDGYFYFVDRIGDTYRWKSENVSTQEVAEALGGFPGLEVANVYGVAVPGSEGRAGMAALVLSDPDAFDGRTFYAWCDDRLPRYAAPVFVRIAGEADTTSTFKLRKVDLQRDGYDPESVRDPLFVRDEKQGEYVRLTALSLAAAGLPAFEHDTGA